MVHLIMQDLQAAGKAVTTFLHTMRLENSNIYFISHRAIKFVIVFQIIYIINNV